MIFPCVWENIKVYQPPYLSKPVRSKTQIKPKTNFYRNQKPNEAAQAPRTQATHKGDKRPL